MLTSAKAKPTTQACECVLVHFLLFQNGTKLMVLRGNEKWNEPRGSRIKGKSPVEKPSFPAWFAEVLRSRLRPCGEVTAATCILQKIGAKENRPEKQGYKRARQEVWFGYSQNHPGPSFRTVFPVRVRKAVVRGAG